MGLPADPGGSFIMVTSYWQPDLEGQGMFQSWLQSSESPQSGCSTQDQKGGNFNSHKVKLSTATYTSGGISLGTSTVGWESPV